MTRTRISIGPLPLWLDLERLLRPRDEPELTLVREPLSATQVRVVLDVTAAAAADIAARLRGLGIDGAPLEVRCDPPLPRALVRVARLRDARARRETTPGFTRSLARASGEGRYSLTPESLALELGRDARGLSVVDACCGSGGNSLGFARAGARVEAIEASAERLSEARHNARVYGVAAQIRFHQGDALTIVPTLRADVLFVDPPWGEYDKRACTLADFPLLAALLALDLSGFGELWLKLPASFATASVPGARASGWFGSAPGDFQRLKFVVLRVAAAARAT